MLHSPFVLIDILGETIAYFCSSRFIMAYSLFSIEGLSLDKKSGSVIMTVLV